MAGSGTRGTQPARQHIPNLPPPRRGSGVGGAPRLDHTQSTGPRCIRPTHRQSQTADALEECGGEESSLQGESFRYVSFRYVSFRWERTPFLREQSARDASGSRGRASHGHRMESHSRCAEDPPPPRQIASTPSLAIQSMASVPPHPSTQPTPGLEPLALYSRSGEP